MLSTFKGLRPDITPAQTTATLIAGVPIAARLLEAFGAYDPQEERRQALSDALAWASVFGGMLIAGDAALRAARNIAAAKTEVVAFGAEGVPPIEPDEFAAEDPEAAAITDDQLPSDEEELAAPPPES
jgi:hypothetical protein